MVGPRGGRGKWLKFKGLFRCSRPKIGRLAYVFFLTRKILNDMETRYVAGSARMKTVTSVNISYDYYRNFCYAYCFAKYLYFKLDLVYCAEYLEHLASCIFTLFMPFFT